MTFRLLLAGVALVGLGATAQAADLLIETPALAPVAAPVAFDWSGFYVGASGGLAGGTVEWDGDYVGVGSDPDVEGSYEVTGPMLGVQAGYNYQAGSFVLGLEGDLSWSGIAGEGDVIDPLSSDPSVPSATVDWLGTLRGRAGVAMDKVLFYGTAGLAVGQGSIEITNVEGGGDDRSADVDLTGWTAGAGVEMAVTEALSVRAEYSYTSVSTGEVDFGEVDTGTPADLLVDGTLGMHAVKLGMNYRF